MLLFYNHFTPSECYNHFTPSELYYAVMLLSYNRFTPSELLFCTLKCQFFNSTTQSRRFWKSEKSSMKTWTLIVKIRCGGSFFIQLVWFLNLSFHAIICVLLFHFQKYDEKIGCVQFFPRQIKVFFISKSFCNITKNW